MTNHVLLNSVDHKDIKIITEHSEELGDDIWYAPTFYKEFTSVQACYPILFHKSGDGGQYLPVAVFGFKSRENLFLEGEKWDASYIPISVQRMPFAIGFQDVRKPNGVETQRVISLDLDSPKVSRENGVELFLEFGGNSPYLEHIANILETLHVGLEENRDFVAVLDSMGLIEPITLDVELKDGSKSQLMGFYTVNDEKLRELGDADILQLHKAGYLQAAYLMLASQVHFRDLVERKNDRLSTSLAR